MDDAIFLAGEFVIVSLFNAWLLESRFEQPILGG
jgi:hypothetical protein